MQLSERQKQEFIHIGRASDLKGGNRILYRFLEIVPGLLSVGTLGLFIILSFIAPQIVAYFTIGFSAYWLFKTLFLTLHLRHSFKRLRHNMQVDWYERLQNLKYNDLVHLVVFPYYKEPYEVLKESVEAIAQSNFNIKQIIVVLAAEERVGSQAVEIARKIQEEYKNVFLDIVYTVHPANTANEMAGKGSNIAYATKKVTKDIVDARKLAYERVIVSAFDSDTVVYPDYFGCLTWYYLTTENPLRASFQPVPLYNNNIWSSPVLSRVLAYSSTFWQMIQQERPERLSTFSSHAMPLSALVAVGFWQVNMVSEDSRIFFNLFMKYDGMYDVIPISYPVSMDANVGKTYWETIKNLYKQHLRWSYGSAENVPYLIFHFLKNPNIPWYKKVRLLFVHIEGGWSLAVQPLILFAVGWLPLLIGGIAFNTTVLSYNLPIVSSWFLTTAMFGLIFLAVYAIQLIPKRPVSKGRFQSVVMIFQWILVPITMVVFSSIPGLDAQIRLAFGKYLGFWVTPKQRDMKK